MALGNDLRFPKPGGKHFQNQQPVWFRQKGVCIGGRWRGGKEGPFGLVRGSFEVGRVLGMVTAVQRGEFKCALRA